MSRNRETGNIGRGEYANAINTLTPAETYSVGASLKQGFRRGERASEIHKSILEGSLRQPKDCLYPVKSLCFLPTLLHDGTTYSDGAIGKRSLYAHPMASLPRMRVWQRQRFNVQQIHRSSCDVFVH